MLFLAAAAAAIFSMPTGQAISRDAADRLPAPVEVLRWQVPSGAPALSGAKPDELQKSVAPVCQQIGVQQASQMDSASVQRGDSPPSRRLNEEPPADVIAAVVYSEGQCSKPLVIGRGVGMPAKPEAPAAKD